MARLFIIQHDCSHGSYFTSRRVCDAVGRFVAALALAPYDFLKRIHLAHHAHSGNLDIRPGGDIPTLTVDEYSARTWWQRLTYRLIRNPYLYLGILVPMAFLAVNRFPGYAPRSWKQEWRSVWWTNVALATALVCLWFAFGSDLLVRIVVIQCMIAFFGGAFSGWINHVQHQYEGAYWRRSGEWDYFDAGLHGASWLDLPQPLRWLTASMGLHHVHHLSARIPNYRLQRCHDENPELWSAHRITLRDGLKAMNLALWDERQGKLISFGEYHQNARLAASGAEDPHPSADRRPLEQALQ